MAFTITIRFGNPNEGSCKNNNAFAKNKKEEKKSGSALMKEEEEVSLSPKGNE